MRRCSVGPGITEGSEAGTGLCNGVEGVQQVTRRSSQTVEPLDHQHITRRESGHCIR